jgi:hypothetical protein
MPINLMPETEVPDTDELSTGRNHDRDDFQKQIDADVAQLVKLWDEQHNPEVGAGAPTKRYVVSTDDRAAMRKVIDRAFTLASHDRTPKIGAGWYLAKTNGSTVALKFAPRYLPVKAASNGTAEQAPAEQPEAPAEQATETEQSSRRAFGRR